jgi:hypothetical protein
MGGAEKERKRVVLDFTSNFESDVKVDGERIKAVLNMDEIQIEFASRSDIHMLMNELQDMEERYSMVVEEILERKISEQEQGMER